GDGTPGGETASGDNLGDGTPGGETASGDNLGGGTPGGETASGDNSGGGTPGGETASGDNSGAIADNGSNTQTANSDTPNTSNNSTPVTYSRFPNPNINDNDKETCDPNDVSCQESGVANPNAQSANSNSGNNNSAATTYSRQPTSTNTNNTPNTTIAANNSESNGSQTYSRTPTQPSSNAIATPDSTTANPANSEVANNTASDSTTPPDIPSYDTSNDTTTGDNIATANPANTDNATSNTPSDSSSNPTNISISGGNSDVANNSANTSNQTYSRVPTSNSDSSTPPSTDSGNNNSVIDNAVNTPNPDSANDTATNSGSNSTDNNSSGNSDIANNNSADNNDSTYSREPSTGNSDIADNSGTDPVDNSTGNSEPTDTDNANTDTSNENGDSTYSREPSTGNSDIADNSGTDTVDNSTGNSDPVSTDNANTDTSNENNDSTYSREPSTGNGDTANNSGSNPIDNRDNSDIANNNVNTPEPSGGNTTAANNPNGTPGETPQQQASSPEESSTSQETDNVSDRVDQLEAAFTQEFQTYLQQQFVTKQLNLQDITERTRDIEQVTGLKTAVIYVSFVPQPLISEANACQTESAPSGDRRFGYTPSASSNCSPEDNQQLELVLITADGEAIQRRVPNAIQANVLAETQTFQRTLSDRRNLGSTKYLDSAQQLYQWLIEPLAEDLEARQIQGLMFAMDSGLRSLPIAALHDGDNFLIENYSVNLIPSFSLMQARNPDIRSRQVLAMGASKFLDLQELPYVPLELSTITEYLWKGKAFLNENFTFQNLQEQISQNEFGIIHLATHAEFKPGNPENSYIQLWNRKLRLNELKELGLSNSNVDLLVLSACRTALGNDEAELGFAGSALQAGVDSTLATLWYVSDEGSLGVTTEFYRQLSQVPIKSEALRRAQLAMIRGEVSIANGQLNYGDKSITLPPEMVELAKTKNLNFSHPYYWAAFTLIGNPQ
ncbi:CHAT domain-containing protein, partial [Coleofasciculus chthonoplastes]|uniref:CHAT domain-containing protein n=1 Tax=Coleofasciculus chthonoplastes TaxID=64178 RepID=UPI0032F1F9FA